MQAPALRPGNVCAHAVAMAAFACSLLAACAADGGDRRVAALFESVQLAHSGDAGVHTWRIPALAVAGDGTLVAAYDARNASSGDLPGDIDVVVRRSSDYGRSWGQVQRVVDFGDQIGGGDPSLLRDRDSGRLFLFYGYAPPGIGLFQSNGDRSPASTGTVHPHLIWSDDHGASWQGPRDLIAEIKPAGARGIFATSGHGIQLSRHSPAPGRLLQPFAWLDAQGRMHAGNAYSDDHGASWRMGASIGTGLDENKAVELGDGRVMQNIRAFEKNQAWRLVAYSSDGGVSYGAVRAEPQLPDPRNNADSIRVHPQAAPGSREASMLLFVNTASTDKREDLTVRLSCDSGRSWPVSKLLHAGPAMYATMARLDDGSFGVLYEHGNAQGITFARFNLAWLGAC